MPNVLLITLPFLNPRARYYPAAYVAGIVRRSGWACRYLDLNLRMYLRSAEGVRDAWDKNVLAATSIRPGLFAAQEALREAFPFAEDLIAATLQAEIRSHRPDLLGVSLYQTCRAFAHSFLEILDAHDIRLPVLFGGADCFPAHYAGKYFDEACAPDLLLQGEAELALPAFLAELEQTGSVATRIPGFLWRAEDGQVVDTGPPAVPDLRRDPVIADFSVYSGEPGHAASVHNTFTSKGCINRCAFCNEWLSFTPCRRREADAVVRELLEAKKHDPGWRSLWLLDSNFNTTVRHVEEFCTAVIRAGLNLRWRSMGCFRVKLSDEALDLMRRSGCIEMMMGLESASQAVIDGMGKNYEINEARDAIRRLVEHGIQVRMPIISGFPGESARDLLTTCAFILAHQGNEHVSFSYSGTCGIFQQTHLNKYPEDFCILPETAGRMLQFELLDGFSTPSARRLRSCLNLFAIGETRKASSSDALSKLLETDFNDPCVAEELAQLVSVLGHLTGGEDEALRLLAAEQTERLPIRKNRAHAARSAFLSGRLPGISLERWLLGDKNAPEVKDAIVDFLLSRLEALARELAAAGEVDFRQFRKSLYRLEVLRDRDPSPGDLQLETMRRSAFDHGRSLIFTGTALDSRRDGPASMVLAWAGDHFIELHYGLPSPAAAEGRPGRGCEFAGFWGKIQERYLREHPLELQLIYRDATTSRTPIGVDLPPRH
ncbi:MAG: radical SAM protein [bacterium]